MVQKHESGRRLVEFTPKVAEEVTVGISGEVVGISLAFGLVVGFVMLRRHKSVAFEALMNLG